MASRTIKVDYLARVEGEGALTVKIKGDKVETAHLRIFEPPRFFEAFLRGRDFREAPDVTARICGICPVAYQMSSIHSMETALGISVSPGIRDLRRLLYCGEWIESHTLHVYMLHAPDFLGYPDAIRLAKDAPEVVKRALALKKIGNEIMIAVGGREIHPINVKVGGFYKAPARSALEVLIPRLEWAREAARETLKLVATFTFPDFEGEYEFVALRHEGEYPMNEGRLVSSAGLDIAVADYDDHFVEEHVARSNALRSHMVRRNGAPLGTGERGLYFVGPLARVALNFDRLPESVRAAAAEFGVDPACRNPFRSIQARALEILYACEEALRIVSAYRPFDPPASEARPKAAVGTACTEAPRGILYHRYEIDDAGRILNAKIVPPTSQNQGIMEEDLRGFVEKHLALPTAELTLRCEQAIRNYDPCISCATHFLRLDVERG